jgi:hypothetical protein
MRRLPPGRRRDRRDALGLLACGVIFAAALIFAPHSDAAAPPEGWGAAEVHVAEAYWGSGTALTCETVTMEFDASGLQNTIHGEAMGEATQPGQREAECILRIAPATDIYSQCLAVVHEYGHLLGHGHSPDPTNVMYFEQRVTEQDVPGCHELAPRRYVTRITYRTP